MYISYQYALVNNTNNMKNVLTLVMHLSFESLNNITHPKGHGVDFGMQGLDVPVNDITRKLNAYIKLFLLWLLLRSVVSFVFSTLSLSFLFSTINKTSLNSRIRLLMPPAAIYR